MKLSVEIVTKFVSSLILMLSGIGLISVDASGELIKYAGDIVSATFVIVGALTSVQTYFKAKRHKEQDNQ